MHAYASEGLPGALPSVRSCPKRRSGPVMPDHLVAMDENISLSIMNDEHNDMHP